MAEGGKTKSYTERECGVEELLGINMSNKWQVHIVGPDDIIPYEDELAALREANALNRHMERKRREYANDPNYPYSIALVEEAEN
jgi:hypothetical protein